jgi:hypothetical protein
VGRLLGIVLAVVALALLAGCGSGSDSGGSQGGSASGGLSDAAQAAAEKDINVKDPNFIGDKQVKVKSCTANACTVGLYTSLIPTVPLVTDRYVKRGGKVVSPSGTIYTFLFTDALLNCMGHFADTQNVSALAPCVK